MKKLAITLMLIAAFGLIPAAIAGTGKKQTKCPICKMDVNKDLHVDYKGKRVYFGCSGCPAEFQKNPDKYINQMESQGIELEKAPVSSDKTGKKGMQHGKMMKEGAMADHGHHPENATETDREHMQKSCMCGMNHLDYSIFEDVGGKRVFFCSQKCKDHFGKDPKKNLEKMEKMGIKLESAPRK